jgi:hypothetical protein
MPSGIDPDEARRARGEADFLTGRALKLAPDNDEVKKLRDRRTDRRKWNRGFESHPFRLPMKLALRLLKLTVKLQVFLWGFEPRRLGSSIRGDKIEFETNSNFRRKLRPSLSLVPDWTI